MTAEHLRVLLHCFVTHDVVDPGEIVWVPTRLLDQPPSPPPPPVTSCETWFLV